MVVRRLRIKILGSIFIAFSVGLSQAAPNTESLDVRTGAMDVDYAGYLSKHDVVFNRPTSNPELGSTVGNGRIGAMVWNESGLNMQISGVDASEETAFSGGLVRLTTKPGLDFASTTFQQRLSLYDGTLTINYDEDRTITVMGAPNSEIIGIHVSDARRNVSQITLDLSIWDVSKLSGGDVPNIDTWRSVALFGDPSGVGLSRGQRDSNHFGYTLAATVEGARFTSQIVDRNTARLQIAPAAQYTIWIVCASRLNAPNHDSVTRARALLRYARTTSYASTLADYKNWWHAFWHKSFVQYAPSAIDGDYLENLYYLYTYIIAAGAYANYPFHFINGDLTAVGDAHSTRWSVAYWNWNERNIFGSFLASNHAEILHVYNHLFTRNLAALREQTRRKYLIDGVWVPETMGWDGNARHTEGSDWTRNILSTGAEVAESLYAEYAYTRNQSLLRDDVYPFAKGVAQFYMNELARVDTTGEYYMANSNALETYWNVKNAITDLAAIRSLFPIVIRTSRELDVDGEMRDQMQLVLDNLAPYPRVAGSFRYAPHDPPTVAARNWQNVTSELIWPYGVTGIDASDFKISLNSWRNRPYAYGNIWSSDAVQAARLGLGDEALKGMKSMIETYQSYPNGLTNDKNGRFEYLGTHLSTINESLLQSYDDKIRVFAAPPSDPHFIGRFSLLARGGFLVTSEYESNRVKYVAIKSLQGLPVTIYNPWANGTVRVLVAENMKSLMITGQHLVRFDTVPNTCYILEALNEPLRTYVHVRLTGSANNDAKRMTNSPATLGLKRP